jgi:hypothetical protein
MEDIIGKISATEKNPSTLQYFYFWTKAGYDINPFDIVKVEHINGSFTFGRIEEISHVTDSASHFSSYVSSNFGETSEDPTEGNTDRIAFNYIKAKVIGNSENIYTPVLHGHNVRLCTVEDIQKALGLDEAKKKSNVVCGYLKMYGQEVPVPINANFLVGPDGAHLNISGISGLACKTSYTMFLMNALQQKYNKENKEKVGYIVFNVKGRDLLSIDEPSEKLSETDASLYKLLELEDKPFSNVHYYFPYSDKEEQHNVQSFGDWEKMLKPKFNKNKASIFKYPYTSCVNKFRYLFANEPDPTNTMESIISWIEDDNDPFNGLRAWNQFGERLGRVINDNNSPARRTIALGSWKKFTRIITKILSGCVFRDGIDKGNYEVVLEEDLRNIKAGEVKVIDIARLDTYTQAFVFGDVMGTIIDMMNTKLGSDALDKIVIFVDELNKYASKDCPSNSLILQHLLDVTERGRSLGIILFGVEQFRSNIHDRVKGNCSTNAIGRTSYTEISAPDYRHLGDTYKDIATRLKPGEYIIQNPALRSVIKIEFPYPTYKQNS